jgi:cobalt/nickel transport system permease protein
MGHVTGIDSLAYRSQALQWPPLGKLLLCVCLLIGSLASSRIYGPLIVLVAGLFLFLYSVRWNIPVFILFLVAAIMSFNVAGVIVIALTQAGSPVFGLSIEGLVINVTREGIDLAAMVFLRSFAGLFIMLFFASSTPVPHIFNSLVRVGIPVYIAEMAMLLYRYSFMILELSERMLYAAGCRLGFSGWRTSMRTTGTLAANLFIRSLEIAERSQNALQSRNFGGSFPVFREPPPLTIAWVAVSLASLASLIVVGNLR